MIGPKWINMTTLVLWSAHLSIHWSLSISYIKHLLKKLIADRFTCGASSSPTIMRVWTIMKLMKSKVI